MNFSLPPLHRFVLVVALLVALATWVVTYRTTQTFTSPMRLQPVRVEVQIVDGKADTTFYYRKP